MSRNRSDGLTGDLFSGIPAPAPATPGSMDFRRTVAELLNDALAKARAEKKLDRYDVAARVSRLADHETSKALLDSYTAASRDECNLPFWKVPLIEIATDTRDLAEWHAEVLGGRILWGADVTDADIGRIERQISELQDQRKALKQFQQQTRRPR